MTTLAKLNAAIEQFAPRAGAVTFSARQLDDGRIQLEADYPATPESIDLEDAAWTVYGGNQILEAAGFDVAKAGMDAYTDKYGDEMIGEWAELTPEPMATSDCLRDALTLEEVVDIVNGGTSEKAEFTGEQLAGQYAEQAAHEAGYAVGRDEIEAHLEFLESAGAAFNFPAAIEHGLELSQQRQAATANT